MHDVGLFDRAVRFIHEVNECDVAGEQPRARRANRNRREPGGKLGIATEGVNAACRGQPGILQRVFGSSPSRKRRINTVSLGPIP